MKTQENQYRDIIPGLFSSDQAYEFRLVPFEKKKEVVHCYTDEDRSQDALNELRVLLGMELLLFPIATVDFEVLLTQNFYKSIAQEQQMVDSEDLLDQILATAHAINSSDVHFEIFKNTTRVRFRMDGKLKEFFSIEAKDYPSIINKIKIKAQLDIAEKRLPQDGRISLETQNGEVIDLRVSSLPTLYGEKLVLRILSRNNVELNLDHLGFSASDLLQYKKSMKRTQGIVLISGPTGSGKTTTLYATLKELNEPHTNIVTIEDPIEYTLEGINQVQLKESIGLTFPNALRSFLRQDPDIIMVGEIRDEKTAQMAIRAALTGHLVFATLHTNSAWASISRLIDMGIPSFLILETLQLSLAQRLIRKLCTHCRKKVKTIPELQPKPPFEFHYTATGCSNCHHTGYRGRIAIYELLPMQMALKTAFNNPHPNPEVYREQHPYNTLKEQAWEVVASGVTSIEEVYSLIAF